MLTQKLKIFEANFRKALILDRRESGFTDTFLFKYYELLPVIFAETAPKLGKDNSLESLSGKEVDEAMFSDLKVYLLVKLNSSTVFPYPFKEEVAPRLKTGEPLGKELMAFAHFLYLSIYLQAWIKLKGIDDNRIPGYELGSMYEESFGKWLKATPSSSVKIPNLDETQRKFLRLHYVYTVSYLAENIGF